MIHLEKFEAGDFKQLIEWISNEELLTNWSGSLFNYPLTNSSLEWYIMNTNIAGRSEAFVYKVIDTKTGITVGHISLGGLSWKNRSARITRVLVGSSAERGRGCCQAMIQAVLKVGFEELKMHRISLGVYDDNHAAIRCYEKSGLRTEGVSREILWYKNAWWNLVEMSILENEWLALNPG